MLRRLSEIAPVTAIRGNIDVHAPDLPDALRLDVRDRRVSMRHVSCETGEIWTP